MDRRVFVVDAGEDAATLAQLGLWAAQNGGSLSTEPIVAETFETPFVTATLEYPSSIALVPEFPEGMVAGHHPDSELARAMLDVPEYTPFSMLVTLDSGEVYSDNQRDVDCAILSAYMGLPVDTIKKTETSAGLEIAFFMTGGTPLWIDPMAWGTYTKLVEGTKGMYLISTNPVFAVALAIAAQQEIKHPPVFKHADLDVWYSSSPPTDVFDTYLDALTDVMCLTPPMEGSTERYVLDEIITAYEYKHLTSYPLDSKSATALDLPVDRYYLIGASPFTAEWLAGAYERVLQGQIPSVTTIIPEVKAPMAAIRHNVIQAYIKTLEARGSTYITPAVLDAMQVDLISGAVEITLIVDAKATLAMVFGNMRPMELIHAATAASMDEGLNLRYRLSQLGVPSLLTMEDTPTGPVCMVTWEGDPEILPAPLSDEKGALKAALLSYLSTVRTGSEGIIGDVVSGRDFPDLSAAELVEVIVTQWRNAYEMSTIARLLRLEDPSNRQPLSPSELARVSFGKTGYFSVGPLLGLRPSIRDVVPKIVMPTEGVIITDISDHITATTLADAADDGAPIELKEGEVANTSPTGNNLEHSSMLQDVDFTVGMMNGMLLPLLSLVVPAGQIAGLTALLTLAWDAGDFLSPWSRAYLCGQHTMSHADPMVPVQIQAAEASAYGTERVITYLKMLKEYHVLQKPSPPC